MPDPAPRHNGPPTRSLYDPAKREAAARLTRDHPSWHVMWGPHSHLYYTYPLFNAPPGTILTATSSGGLERACARKKLTAIARRPPIQRTPQPAQPPEGGPHHA